LRAKARDPPFHACAIADDRRGRGLRMMPELGEMRSIRPVDAQARPGRTGSRRVTSSHGTVAMGLGRKRSTSRLARACRRRPGRRSPAGPAPRAPPSRRPSGAGRAKSQAPVRRASEARGRCVYRLRPSASRIEPSAAPAATTAAAGRCEAGRCEAHVHDRARFRGELDFEPNPPIGVNRTGAQASPAPPRPRRRP